MRRGLATVLLLGLLLGLAALWFVRSYERREVSTPVPPQEQAWNNRFLAAARLLERFGVRSRYEVGLEGAPRYAAGSVIVLPAPRGHVSAAALARLRAAVQDGAHLIVESERTGSGDPVFDAFGLRRAEPDRRSCQDAVGWDLGDWGDRREQIAVTSSSLLRVDSLGEPALRAAVAGAESLSSAEPPLWQLSGCDGVRVLHRELGRGRLTAINDLRFAANWDLARADNAEFLWRLLQLGGAPAEVVFHGPPEGGLGQWLGRHAWRVLASLAVLVVLWLWSRMPRFGPVRADPEPVRRRLLEHLRASGRLLWSQQARAELARAAREAALTRVAREHPHARALAPADLVAFLQQRYGLPRLMAQAVVDASLPADAAAFIALARACRALHAAPRRRAAARSSPVSAASE